MSAGSHTVKISTDGGVNYQNYGSITYSEKPTLAGCDTTSMQTFGANGAVCKAAMKQGQVIVLNDPRGNSDSPNGQKYRVKKMPDGNVWMIDNLKLGSTTSTTALTPADTNISSNYTLPTINTTNNNADPGGTEYCSSTGTVWTLVSGSLTGCGYMYNWNTLMAETISESGFSISPKGWNIAKSATGITYSALSEAMAEKASNAAGKRNPVYNTTAWRNFEGINTPWQSFRAGNYRGGNPTLQGSHGYWASQTEQPSPNEIYIFLLCLWYNGVGPNDQNVNLKTNGTSVRSVL
jgi:hypothetical protein